MIVIEKNVFWNFSSDLTFLAQPLFWGENNDKKTVGRKNGIFVEQKSKKVMFSQIFIALIQLKILLKNIHFYNAFLITFLCIYLQKTSVT
jgi:hypothetical protein